MNETNEIAGTGTILETLTHTLLYEGYALYPYYRSAIKNQKPIPFGVVFPGDYHALNEHARAFMQSGVIIVGSEDLTVSIDVKFLHLRRTALFEYDSGGRTDIPSAQLEINGHIYQAGWQTIERKVNTGSLSIGALIQNCQTFEIRFDNMGEGEIIFNEQQEPVARSITSVAAIRGLVTIKAEGIIDLPGSFRITVTVTNDTPVENAGIISRDDVLLQSFLSTHIILQTAEGTFISQQDPPEEYKSVIAACNNINSWPMLIDRNNKTMLSSPIILYDYPEINPKSSGDLFDSTEIEEALLLHVNLLSDEEKQRIGGNDPKLQAMLNKVSNMTPEDFNIYHSMMKGSEGEFNN